MSGRQCSRPVKKRKMLLYQGIVTPQTPPCPSWDCQQPHHPAQVDTPKVRPRTRVSLGLRPEPYSVPSGLGLVSMLNIIVPG